MWTFLFILNAVLVGTNIHSGSYGWAGFAAMLAVYCAFQEGRRE